LRHEWRGLKVPGHVDEVLKEVKALKKATSAAAKDTAVKDAVPKEAATKDAVKDTATTAV
jgi:peroxiredoxin Q/BCP